MCLSDPIRCVRCNSFLKSTAIKVVQSSIDATWFHCVMNFMYSCYVQLLRTVTLCVFVMYFTTSRTILLIVLFTSFFSNRFLICSTLENWSHPSSSRECNEQQKVVSRKEVCCVLWQSLSYNLCTDCTSVHSTAVLFLCSQTPAPAGHR